jgi:hypothetical protein
MSGLLQLLRASLLGACLCIAAAQLGHAETRGAGLTQSGQHAPHAGVQAQLQPQLQAQWKAYAQSDWAGPAGPSRRDGAPSDSQMPGDPASDSDADATDGADGAGDFDDASLHAHLSLFCLDFGVSAALRGGQRERVHARREDRRCEKPPRPRVA